MIQVNMQNFKLFAFLLLEIRRNKNFLQNGTSHAIRYLSPGIEQNSEKSLFMPGNIFPGKNLYPLYISMVLKQSKKIVCSTFRDISFQKQLQQPPGKLILLKFCQMCLTDKIKKLPSLEMLDRAVLELWSII